MMVPGSLKRKEVVLSTVALYLVEREKDGADGVDWAEIVDYLRSREVRRAIGFNVVEPFLLASLVLGSEPGFWMDRDWVVRFREDSESQPGRRKK